MLLKKRLFRFLAEDAERGADGGQVSLRLLKPALITPDRALKFPAF